MKPRTCFLWLWIANDAGKTARYSVKPLPAAERALSVAAFRLVNLSKFPNPAYTVRLALDGQASCSCPQHQLAAACKHTDALVAAGVLPCALLGLLLERTKQLHASEAEAQRLAEAAIEEQTVHQHDAQWSAERIADLTAAVHNLNERAARLQFEVAAYHAGGPKRRRAARPAKAA